MRRKKITKELENLSKRAKELCFPQNVKEGDWVSIKGWLILVTKSFMTDEVDYTLILSFSRCLEWLKGKGWRLEQLEDGGAPGNKWCIGMVKRANKHPDYRQIHGGKTHHEAICKAVVKILEERQQEEKDGAKEKTKPTSK